MRVAVILLVCFTALASGQFNQDVEGLPPRGLPATLRSARFQRLPSARPALPTQPGLSNQRIRRPIAFNSRSKGPEDSIGTGPSSFAPVKPLRPNLPSGPTSLPAQVKPVSEEPDESARDRDNQDDEADSSNEPVDSPEESEENVPRAVTNHEAIGSISRTAGNVGPSGQSVHYRSLSTAGGPTGRSGGIQATPPPAPVQYRPAPKPNKPRKQVEEPFKQQVKPPAKPLKSSQSYETRGKKPVAQIIRRYRNDNADGSITWGFENDDGSYKEEIIGVDCITRGKYGYIDPDGIRREYTYETGIKCDEEQREEDEENGFVDYQENKLVLPDGKTIDLSSMGKKQTRRPRFLQRN